MRKPYRIEAKADSNAELYIYEQIGEDWWTGEGITAKQMIEELKALGPVKHIDMYIDCAGGDVFQGWSIYTALRAMDADITAHVTGLCASMATIILLAADERIFYSGSMAMIHNPWTCAQGDYNDLKKASDMLEKMTSQFHEVYSERCGQKVEDVATAMDNETWFTAREAVDWGLGTLLDEEQKAVALVMEQKIADHCRKTPENVGIKDVTKRDAETILRQNGFSRNEAKAILSNQRDADEESQRDAEEKAKAEAEMMMEQELSDKLDEILKLF